MSPWTPTATNSRSTATQYEVKWNNTRLLELHRSEKQSNNEKDAIEAAG
jgi:hypothetical protein